MPKFKVISSQIVYNSTIVEAENKDEANQLAYEGDPKWDFYDCANWQIDEVEEIKNA
jgi:hypothetical protein